MNLSYKAGISLDFTIVTTNGIVYSFIFVKYEYVASLVIRFTRIPSVWFYYAQMHIVV